MEVFLTHEFTIPHEKPGFFGTGKRFLDKQPNFTVHCTLRFKDKIFIFAGNHKGLIIHWDWVDKNYNHDENLDNDQVFRGINSIKLGSSSKKVKTVTTHQYIGSHEGMVTNLIFHSNFGLLVSASSDGTIKTWDPFLLFETESMLLQTLNEHESAVTCLSTHYDILISGSSNGTIICWTPQKGRQEMGLYPWFIPLKKIEIGNWISSIWSPRETIVGSEFADLLIGDSAGNLYYYGSISEGLRRATIIDFILLKKKTRFRKMSITKILPIPTHNFLITNCSDGVIRFTDLHGEECFNSIENSNNSIFVDITFNPQHEELILLDKAGEITVYETKKVKLIKKLQCTQKITASASFLNFSQHILVAGVFSVECHQIERFTPCISYNPSKTDPILSFFFDCDKLFPSENRLITVSGGKEKKIGIWRMDTISLKSMWSFDLAENESEFRCCYFFKKLSNPENSTLFSNNNSSKFSLHSSFEEDSEIINCRTLITGHDDGTIMFWNLGETMKRSFVFKPHKNTVSNLYVLELKRDEKLDDLVLLGTETKTKKKKKLSSPENEEYESEDENEGEDDKDSFENSFKFLDSQTVKLKRSRNTVYILLSSSFDGRIVATEITDFVVSGIRYPFILKVIDNSHTRKVSPEDGDSARNENKAQPESPGHSLDKKESLAKTKPKKKVRFSVDASNASKTIENDEDPMEDSGDEESGTQNSMFPERSLEKGKRKSQMDLNTSVSDKEIIELIETSSPDEEENQVQSILKKKHQKSRKIRIPCEILSMLFYENEKLIIVGSNDGSIKLWHVNISKLTGKAFHFQKCTGELPAVNSPNYLAHRHKGGVEEMVLDGNFLFSLDDLQVLIMWDLNTKTLLKRITAINTFFSQTHINHFSILKNDEGNFLFTSRDGNLAVFDYSKEEFVFVFEKPGIEFTYAELFPKEFDHENESHNSDAGKNHKNSGKPSKNQREILIGTYDGSLLRIMQNNQNEINPGTIETNLKKIMPKDLGIQEPIMDISITPTASSDKLTSRSVDFGKQRRRTKVAAGILASIGERSSGSMGSGTSNNSSMSMGSEIDPEVEELCSFAVESFELPN